MIVKCFLGLWLLPANTHTRMATTVVKVLAKRNAIRASRSLFENIWLLYVRL